MPGAVLHDARLIVDRCLRMVEQGRIEAIDGSSIELEVESICVHGDTPGAVEIASAVRTALTDRGAQLASLAPPPTPR